MSSVTQDALQLTLFPHRECRDDGEAFLICSYYKSHTYHEALVFVILSWLSGTELYSQPPAALTPLYFKAPPSSQMRTKGPSGVSPQLMCLQPPQPLLYFRSVAVFGTLQMNRALQPLSFCASVCLVSMLSGSVHLARTSFPLKAGNCCTNRCLCMLLCLLASWVFFSFQL